MGVGGLTPARGSLRSSTVRGTRKLGHCGEGNGSIVTCCQADMTAGTSASSGYSCVLGPGSTRLSCSAEGASRVWHHVLAKPIHRWGTAPREHEGLAMTRALFGAGVLEVELRNSDQGNSFFTPGSWGSRLKLLIPQLRMEGIGCLLQSPCQPRLHPVPTVYTPPRFQVPPTSSGLARPLTPPPAFADPDGPGEGRAGPAAAAPQQAGAGGGHDGPEQLSHLVATTQQETSERACRGGLRSTAKAGRSPEAASSQLCRVPVCSGWSCWPVSSWPPLPLPPGRGVPGSHWCG